MLPKRDNLETRIESTTINKLHYNSLFVLEPKPFRNMPPSTLILTSTTLRTCCSLNAVVQTKTGVMCFVAERLLLDNPQFIKSSRLLHQQTTRLTNNKCQLYNKKKRTMSTTLTHLGAATLNEQTSKEPNKLPLPPFTRESAIEKIRLAEDAWNTQDPSKVKMAYTPDTIWRNRSTFLKGRDEVEEFLQGKWDRELNYKLIKELWAYEDNRIAVRFCYEYQNAKNDGQWFRAYGNENWEFTNDGRMAYRHASINDVPIEESERKFTWEGHATSRPKDFPGLSELGL